ncbi:TetR/AcrR family transcriptional regulator [Nocardia sp. XZ_19_385]|uniref:TetR/AcrR family transcriptional regulator n=1 Tax=Nocardia sp. XZ_19_385 TaxID=2769488 RepID=UPI0018908717|nr:TetR/AcrR family transcriptional regulator [Nocardia sp. XZ_19_385]
MTTTPTSRRQMYAAATRTALLDAGRESFAERGYAGTSIEDITAAALISKGAFYRHFADKQAIFLDLFAERLHDAAESIEEAVTGIQQAEPGAGPPIAIACAYAFAARSISDPVHRELLRQAPEVLGEQKYNAIDDKLVLPPVQRLLAVLAERGELRDGVPLETTARLLLRLMCASNTIIANAADRESMLAECATTMMFIFAGVLKTAET